MVDSYLETTNIHDDFKKEALSISCMVQSLIEEKNAEEIKDILNAVSVFDQVGSEDIAKELQKNPFLGEVCPYVTAREKLKSSAMYKIK